MHMHRYTTIKLYHLLNDQMVWGEGMGEKGRRGEGERGQVILDKDTYTHYTKIISIKNCQNKSNIYKVR